MRLIDADALKDNCFIYDGDDLVGRREYVMFHEIDEAPTIVPSADFVRRKDIDRIKRSSDWLGIPSAEPSKSTDQNVADVPSGDLISRAEALDVVCKELQYQEENRIPYDSYDSGTCYGLKTARELLLALPSADRPQVNSNSAEEQIAEICDRPKGEWIDVEHEPFCECSVCGAYIENLDDDFAFCPRCGADMRPEK